MPFAKGTTPPRLADKGIPQKFIDTFIGVFNSVMEKETDEGKAYRQGCAAKFGAVYHKNSSLLLREPGL